jgi:5-(carboxyamino)imidazole ribonucleotide mutase
MFSRSATMEPLVGIIVGSKSDFPHVDNCTKVLDEFGVPHRVAVASAHRAPDFLEKTIEEMEKQVEVYIAFAGMAAHLPGVVASKTVKPVIGVPISVSLSGLDALLSIVQMPPGVPVGAMAIDGAKNAAIFATGILATTERGKALKLGDKLTQMRAKRAAENYAAREEEPTPDVPTV